MAKFVKAIEQGDISNGRFEIWLASLRGFCAEPIWGHGIGQISRDLSYVHPHNSVVQLLYDGGLLLLALVLIPTCCIAIRFLRLRTKSLQHIMLVVLLIFLFFISVPNSMLSGDLWSNSRVWLLVGFCLSLYAKNEYLYNFFTSNDMRTIDADINRSTINSIFPAEKYSLMK